MVVEAKVVEKRGFYEERAGCKFFVSFIFAVILRGYHMLTGRLLFILYTVSPLSLFKNPMILLVVFALGVTIGMPYLMEMSTFLSSDTPRPSPSDTNHSLSLHQCNL